MSQKDTSQKEKSNIKWLLSIQGILPPFCVEIVLYDGTSFYLHSVETNPMFFLRVWDFRALSEEDMDSLKKNISCLTDRCQLNNEQGLHSNLDWANLHIETDQIAYCVEWHNRSWPILEERRSIGFRTDHSPKPPSKS
jgi:hypothetical protein